MSDDVPTPAPTDDIEYTPEQLALAQRIVAAERARQEAIALAKRAAYAMAVRDLITSPAWGEVLSTIGEIRDQYEADDIVAVHVNALGDIMPRAAEAALSLAPPPGADSQPSPSDPPAD
jgi:hypothetical protein